MEIIGVLVAGIIIGVLGKFLAPGVRDKVPMWLTILCGIAGVIFGWYIYVAFGGNGSPGIDWVRWLIAIAVAAVLVVIASTLTGRIRKRQENATGSQVHGNVRSFGNVPPENLEGASGHQGRAEPATDAVVAEPKPTESQLGPHRIDGRQPDVVSSEEDRELRHEVSPDRAVDSALRLPAPDLPAVARSALVVATSKYVDPSLRTLRAPATDAVAFAEVLANPDIGGFSVSSEIDRTDYELRIAIQDFLSDRSPEEIVLLYVSSHGVTDKWRRLYFAATNTVKTRLAATGLAADWVLQQLEDCQARSQLVILDCCFSGAFSLRAKGDDDLNLSQLTSPGRGRAVLTASNAREYSFEQGLDGDPVEGTPAPGSIFTAALLDGLRTGAADKDNNGYITVEEAYAYAYQQVRSKGMAQTPQRWLYGGEGDILLGRSPLGRTIKAIPLPEALRSLLEHPYAEGRITAVQRLSQWLTSDDPARVVTARRELQKVADEDIPRVATVARTVLDTNPSPR